MPSASGHQLPKRVFPVPYQVDFSVESKGRHLDSTKRKLTWKFGFAHPPAVFPHLFDADEKYMGDITNDGSIIPYPENPKKGIECRGREHEIILTWSLLTGKAHIYVDSREIYRHEPIKDEIFNPFSAQFHRGFDLPNPKFNGRHRIDIRCYARTPMGAKNMVVDDSGGKFRQYDLTVDGLSYFSMPAMYELGTDRMWGKVSRWGMMRRESQGEEDVPRGGGQHGEHRPYANSGEFESKGRMVDDYYFDKAKKRPSKKYGQSLSRSEMKEMNPRTESEEEQMMRIAMEASLKDWEKDVGYGKKKSGSGHKSRSRSSSSENDSSYSNGRKEGSSSRGGGQARKTATKMASIGEDNLIDFGTDEAANAMSQITISRQTTSDVSVLADNDDATTASFVMGTAWNSSAAPPPPPPQQIMQPAMSPAQPYNPNQLYPNQQQQQQQILQSQPPPHYHDPTFQPQYAQQHAQPQWNNVGTLSTPRGSVDAPSDASFAVPPPPTLDDYKDAFGGSMMNMGASVVGGSTVMTTTQTMMSPGASVGMASPMTQGYPQQQQAMAPQYGMQQASQWQSQSFGGPGVGASSPQVSKANKFDPLRADPFAS